VLLATLGVLAVVYGGSRGFNGLEDIQKRSSSAPEPPKAPLIGDLLTLVASIGYGLYQVLYKRYAALPFDPKLVGEDHYTPASQIEDTGFEEIEDLGLEQDLLIPESVNYSLPFGLYPNLITSAIGFCTCTVFWILLVIVHFTGVEKFRVPTDLHTVLCIAGIAASGVLFNAGFMVRIILLLVDEGSLSR